PHRRAPAAGGADRSGRTMTPLRHLAVRAVRFLRMAAAFADEDAAGDPLAVSLELLRDVDDLGEVGDRHAVRAHQRDGDAHEREALEMVQAIPDFDVAALAVDWIVELRHRAVELADDLLAEPL